jgi:homoaconitase/3-isopropylmalate dehydratase large subunit
LNFLHRVLAKAAGRDLVEPGQEISVSPDLALGHDGSAEAVLSSWPSDGKVAQPEKTVFVIDHLHPAPTVSARELHLKLHAFARKQRIQLYNRGEGVLHQVVAEQYTPQPGWLLAGADGHVATAGAFGALAFSLSPGELVSVLLSGTMTLKVPQVYTVEVTGSLSSAATVRDLGLMLLGRVGHGLVKGKALAFQGPGVWGLSQSGKMSLCNLIGETGATTGLIIPPGEQDNASSVDLLLAGETVEPVVACPPSPTNVRPLKDIAGLPLTQVLVGGCASGRLEDMRELLRGLAGRPVHRDVTLLVVPASRNVLNVMEEQGLSRSLRDQGALLLPPGCGPCPGKHLGLIASQDRLLAATVRNTPGRMGSAEAEIYLASPRTAGASAAAGVLADAP